MHYSTSIFRKMLYFFKNCNQTVIFETATCFLIFFCLIPGCQYFPAKTSLYRKFTAWRGNSASNFTRNTDIAREVKPITRRNQTFCAFGEPCRCANDGNPFKVSCQDLANRKQSIFRMETTFI